MKVTFVSYGLIIFPFLPISDMFSCNNISSSLLLLFSNMLPNFQLLIIKQFKKKSLFATIIPTILCSSTSKPDPSSKYSEYSFHFLYTTAVNRNIMQSTYILLKFLVAMLKIKGELNIFNPYVDTIISICIHY